MSVSLSFYLFMGSAATAGQTPTPGLFKLVHLGLVGECVVSLRLKGILVFIIFLDTSSFREVTETLVLDFQQRFKSLAWILPRLRTMDSSDSPLSATPADLFRASNADS